MTESIEVIKAERKEVEVICELVGSLLSGFNRISGASFNTNKNQLEEVCYKLIGRENYGAFIAYNSNNTPVGLITIAEAFSIYNGGDFGVITELYVHDEYRSHGIGKLLLNAVIDFSKLMSWDRIEVGAPNQDDWPRTISFYETNGFIKGGPKLRKYL